MDENQTMDHDRIMKINIEEEMKSSYIDAMVSSLCTAVSSMVCWVLETPVINLTRSVPA